MRYSGPVALLEVTLLRHGATTWNENSYCQGRKDVPLSARGREQARLLAGALEGKRFRRAFASPLQRARQTIEALGHTPEVLPELLEIDRGHWEGHTMEEVHRRWAKLYEGWYGDPSGLAMPGGESFESLWERAGQALERFAACEGPVIACGHKAINRAILARALGRLSAEVWKIPQPQACRSVLILEQGVWRAEVLGDVSHLPAAMRSDS